MGQKLGILRAGAGISCSSKALSSLFIKTVSRCFAKKASDDSPPSNSDNIVTVCVPTLAESITEGTLASWEVALQGRVQRDQVLAQLETDKITVPVNSPCAGLLVERLVGVGQTVGVGQGLCRIDQRASSSEGADKEAQGIEGKKESAPTKPKQLDESPPLTFDARPVEEKVQPAPHLPSPQKAEARTEAMSRMRIRIAERMKESQNTSASLTTFNEVDMSAVMAMRDRYKDLFSKKHNAPGGDAQPVKLGLVSPFMMAVTRVLQERDFAVVNARISPHGHTIIHPASIDISVAVATPKVEEKHDPRLSLGIGDAGHSQLPRLWDFGGF